MIKSQAFQNNIETLDYPVSRLFKKYNRVRSVIYDRMNALSIETFKKDGRAYITHAQLKLLDELDNYLQKGNGRTIKKFIKLKNLPQPPDTPDTPDTAPDVPYTPPSMPKNRRNSVTYIEADTPDTAPDVWYMPPDTPDIRYNTSPHNETNEPSYYINKINEMRAFYQFLDNAVENGWRLTNEYLAELLRINIQEIKDSDSWFFAGYDFNKICIDFEKGVKEEWWAVNYFEEDQAGVTCLGKNLNRADS